MRLSGAVALTIALGACTGGGSPIAASTARSDRPTTSPKSTSPSRPTTGSPANSPTDATAESTPFCLTSAPASWTSAEIAEAADVVTMSPAGSVRWSDPELRWAGKGSSVRISNVPAPGLGNAWLVGEHVAYERLRSEQNWGDWELLLWDSVKQAKPIKLDESDGHVPHAPFLLLTASDHALAWLHPLEDGRRQVRFHDVGTGITTVVRVGHVGTPLVAGQMLMWPEASAPNAAPRLAAVDLGTLKPIQLPRPLAELRDPQEMSSDGRVFAWVSADRSQLMAWQQGWPAARVIVRATGGNPISWPRVSGNTVTWVADRTYTADLRSGSYAPMTRQWGGAEVWGAYLHIGVPNGSGSSYHVKTSTLPPLPRCD